jgi:hypothetical protein
MRTNPWLAERLDAIHQQYFSDVPIRNVIMVKFGRESRSRFGSIIARERKGYTQPISYITINSLFRDETVPEYVIDATLAHEFTHYTHGFHSPLERRYPYPHRGGIVDKELVQRGAGELLKLQKAWIKKESRAFLTNHHLL